MIWRAGIVATVLGLLGGLAGVWIGANILVPQENGATSLHSIVHHELALSSEQEAEIEALEQSFAAQKASYDARIAEARQAIGTALMAERAMSPDVEAAAAQFHDVMGELQLATLNHILAMRQVMTEDQRTEFDLRLAGAFDVEP
jgi:hypothetical protein